MRSEAAPGLCGGERGADPVSYLRRGDETIEIPRRTHVRLEVEAGDRLFHSTAGAGGYGPAEERDPALVAADLRDGKLTEGGAAAQYRSGAERA
jgi:N-methylhydantoinase B